MFVTQKLKQYSPALLVCFLAVFLVGVVWWVTLKHLDNAKEKFIAGAERDVTSFARIFEEHTARTIQSADQAVQFLKFGYQTEGKRLDINRLLRSGVILDDIFNLYSIVDLKGDLVLSTQPFKSVNLSDREHIRVHRDNLVDGLFVSKPVLGRVSGKWSIQLTRRIAHPDGSYAGVVVVSMDPFYFTRLYESARIGKHSSIALIGEDGIVRARCAGNGSQIGQDVSGSDVFEALKLVKSGVVLSKSVIDQRVRLYAYRKIEAYPLYVVVGIDQEDLLQPYMAIRSQVLRQAAFTTIVIIVLSTILALLIVRLIRSRQHALSASAAKTQFLSNMSHELRTPLNGILGYAEFLHEDLPDGELRTFAKNIHDSGQHLLSLVNALLHLNKIEEGQIAVSLSMEDIRKLATQAVNTHRSTAAAKGLQLEFRVAGNVPDEVSCDRMKILQILNNLLHNAVKFTDTGSIRLDVSVEGNELRFRVADTGVGIPEGVQSMIFEKFFQVDSGNSRSAEGTGLGLAIVKELVRLLSGEIHVESSPGMGTAISVVLPLQQNDDCPHSNTESETAA